MSEATTRKSWSPADRSIIAALLRAHLDDDVDALTWIPTSGPRVKVERAVATARTGRRARTRVVPLDVWGKGVGRLVARGANLDRCVASTDVLRCWLEQRHELDDVVRALLDSFEELHLLWDLAERMRDAATFADVAQLAVSRLHQVMPCRELALYEADDDGFARVASAGVVLPLRMRADDPLRTLLHGQSANVVEARALRSSGSDVAAAARREFAIARLRGTRRTCGWLIAADRLDARGEARAFSATDRRLCETVASLASTMHESLARAAATRELALAHRVQRALIPASAPSVDGFEIAFVCAPRAAAGGDFVAFQKQRGGALAIATGDVAGHDVAAAVLMGAARAALLVAASEGRGPAAVLRQGARCLHADLVRAESFVCALAVRLVPASAEVTVALAGHPPLFVWSPGRFECQDLGGPILGVDARFAYDEHALALERGAILVAASDGVLEATGKDGELFGETGLKRALDTAKPRSAAAALLAINAALAKHAPAAKDDRTVLVVRRTNA
ncbi:MAG: SpoIIE family protein phosphatase [Planctomycetes bacterium]|nr:SpoIIE family protein phosphatase [Planctomycetota bacterium]MCC7172669.1 SpoIIE family protein phosphatase [Planctomycetota bacterium]